MERKDFIRLVKAMSRDALIHAALMTREALQNTDAPIDTEYYDQIFVDSTHIDDEGGE